MPDVMPAARAALGAVLAVVLAAFAWVGVGVGPAAAASGSPVGNFEGAVGVDGGVEIKGWALDPDTSASIYLWVTVDRVGRHVYANQSRPDVGAAYPGYGSAHGFRATLAASAGTHRVCVAASNVGPGEHQGLGCRTVTVRDVHSPAGNFEGVGPVAGGILVRGWALDPDTAASIYLWVTVDGVGRHVYANYDRPDIGRAFPAYGSAHGFRTTVSASAGTHRVCATASNVGAGAHKDLGCRSVTIPDSSPFGNIEQASAITGGISLKGWAIDPDTTSSIYLWVTLDGAGRHWLANRDRQDIANAFPGFGPNHGFQGSLAASPGTHRVCVTAVNVGPGSHKSLGCWTVTVPGSTSGPAPRPASPDLDCQDFVSWSEAQATYTYWLGQGLGDVHNLDANNDGIACEALR